MAKETGIVLPQGYDMVNKHRISAMAVIGLRAASQWGTEQDLMIWEDVIDESLSVTGVVGPGKDLVGVGFLAGNLRHAVLCDLVVHPDHRGRGIGQAIIRRRVQLAGEMNIPYLYTELSHTNTLTTLYQELGFAAAGNIYTRAARRHPLEQQMLEARQQ